MAQGELRLPLQVGTSSLAGFARAAATFFPGILLIGSIVLPALLAPWDEAAEVYPHLIVPYAFAVFGGSALLVYARKHLALAFRERPSDVVFAGDLLRIDGGPMNGWEVPFVDIETARVVGRHEKLELVDEDKKSENFWQLVIDLKDGSKKRLGSAEDTRERDSLQALCDSIKASLKKPGEAGSQHEPQAPLKCSGCGAPAEPSDQEVVPCKYCSTPIRMPEDVRTRIHAMKQRRVSDERSNKLVQKLVNQPGALRTSFFVFLAAIPSLLIWPAAIVFAGVLYALCYLRAGNGFLLVVASYGVIFALYFLVRGQLTDRQALRLLTLGFAARAPKEAGGAHHCRQCNGPLVPQPGNVLVRCAYCGAENVLGLDMRGAAHQSKEQVESLDDALFRRKSERARWRFSAFIAIVVLVIVAVLVRISAHPPNPLKAIADARELKRITYDPFNEFQPKLSPDGKTLLYDLRVPGEDSDESIMSAPATGAFRGTEMTAEKVHAIRPLWMSDGKGFLYISSTKRDVLRRVDSLVPYAPTRDLYSFVYDIDVPSMSPDGNHFTFAAADSKSSGWYVYVGALDGSQSKQLTGGINPAWSPDASHIAYSRTVGQYRQLNVMILDGTTMVTTQQLTTDTCDHEDPVYSPDGQYIAYVGNCGGNTRGKKNIWDLYVMRADGTQNEQLTDGKADVETPAWNGDYVYFSADIAGNYDIWRVRVTGLLAGHGVRPAFVAPLVQQIPSWMLPKQDWAGTYNCAQGPTSAVLHITSVSNDVIDGTFDFKFASNGTTAAGQYKVHGKMTATGGIDLDPGDWIVHPKNYVAVGLHGNITDNKLFTGTMKSSSCSTFSLLRKMKKLALALACLACGSAAQPEPDAGDAAVDAGADVANDAPANVDATTDATIDAPDIDTIEWQTGASIGNGVAFKDTGNAVGDAMFIGYGGYGAELFESELWVTALFRATLRARGVRWVWAVQGPSDPDYSQDEIGNSKIAATLVPLVAKDTPYVIIAAHSSGAFVAEELLEQLASGADPQDVTKDLVVYFALDGGGATQSAIDRTKNAYFCSSHDGATQSANYGAMQSLAATYASKGGFFDNDATASGCDSGAVWCVHDTLINTRPHDPTDLDVPDDYSDFAGRPVCTSYLDAKL